MTPCLIRDHDGDLVHILNVHQPYMNRPCAPDSTADPDYAGRMIVYGQAGDALSKPVWEQGYLKRRRKAALPA